MQKLPVTVLGATGLVGQRFVARLAEHPWFELAHLAASERNLGRRYGEVVPWSVPSCDVPAAAAELVLQPCNPRRAWAPVVFSALSAEVARRVEPEFARAGALVFSNASAFRMEPDVPLLVPEVNAEHAGLLGRQREARGWTGGLICNPNCTTAILVSALAPLHAAFGVVRVVATSFQAASGAGLPGVPDAELLGNVLPHIAGEEQKLAAETAKLLGRFEHGGVRAAELVLSASCQRVPVVDGHMLAVSCELGAQVDPARVREVLAAWAPLGGGMSLPSAPARPVLVHTDEARPQPRRDVETDGGMPVHVGRVRTCPVLGIQFTVLGHNLERGAAGGSLLNAELLRARGLLD